MKYKIIFILIFTILFSCQKKAEIGIGNIQIPKYYKKYDFWKFNDSVVKSKGYKVYEHSKQPKRKRYFWKDGKSKNFLNITELLNGALSTDKNERVQYFEDVEEVKAKVINENYEIYQGNGNGKDDITNENFNWYKTYFLIRKDTACFVVYYCTYDNDPIKINDYQNTINKIESECAKGSVFKTSAGKDADKVTISN